MLRAGIVFAASVCVRACESQSHCLSRACAVQKTNGCVEVLFELKTLGSPRNIVLDVGPHLAAGKGGKCVCASVFPHKI